MPTQRHPARGWIVVADERRGTLGQSEGNAQDRDDFDGVGGRKRTRWAHWNLVSAPRGQGSLNDTRQEVVKNLERDPRQHQTRRIGLRVEAQRIPIQRALRVTLHLNVLGWE
jgi:hypothetical protein